MPGGGGVIFFNFLIFFLEKIIKTLLKKKKKIKTWFAHEKGFFVFNVCLAISEGHGDAALELLKAGAETDKRDVDGHLAIDLAPDSKVSKKKIKKNSVIFIFIFRGNSHPKISSIFL